MCLLNATANLTASLKKCQTLTSSTLVKQADRLCSHKDFCLKIDVERAVVLMLMMKRLESNWIRFNHCIICHKLS